MKYFGFALLFALLFADNSCGIDLGNIGDFVIQYKLIVTNSTTQEAVVGIYGDDVRERAVVPAGQSLEATSYVGGFFDIWASPSSDTVTQLKTQAFSIEAMLAQKPLSADQAATLSGQLANVNAQIKGLSGHQVGGVCWSTLKPDEDGKGGEYDYTATQDASGQWKVDGFCAN